MTSLQKNYEKIYKKIRNQIQKRKQNFYEINLKQKINKPKELWKTLKPLGLPSKALSSNAFTESKVTYYYDNIKFKNLKFWIFWNISWNNIKYFERFESI